MKATIDIEKVKVKNGLFLIVDYKRDFEGGKVRNIVNEQCNAPIHPDLIAAFDNLRIHLAVLTEYIDEENVDKDIDRYEHTILEQFKVTQISIGGDGEGVTLTGQKRLKSKKVLNLNAPFQKYFEDEGYSFGADLQIAVDRVITEVEAYMDGTKRGEGAQLEMQLEGNEGGDGDGGEDNDHNEL
jgi:hypothetical protein